MHFYILVVTILFVIISESLSQLSEIKYDNGVQTGHSYISKRHGWEEGVSFKISAPCYVRK